MESPVTLHQTARPDERADALPELDYVLNMALVYQDALTEQWASQIRERVSQLVGPQAARSTAWKISDLSEPEVLKQAVLHTANADVIVVSLQAAEELPRDLHVWIDAWLPHRLQVTGVLVALLGLPDPPDPQSDWAREYLRAVARKAGLDFLVEERTHTAATLSASPELPMTDVSAPPKVLYLPFEQDGSTPEVRHWGINE